MVQRCPALHTCRSSGRGLPCRCRDTAGQWNGYQLFKACPSLAAAGRGPTVGCLKRAGRSVQTCHCLHQRRQRLRRASGESDRERRGPSSSTRRERRSGPDQCSKLKDSTSGPPEDSEAESSSPTRKAMPARGNKTLGRHVGATRRPDPESGWRTREGAAGS